MNTTTTYLSKKGMKDLKRQVHQLERRLAGLMKQLRSIDKTEIRENRFERMEKLAAIEAVELELSEKRTSLNHAQLLPRKRDALRVALGSVVELVDQQGRLMRCTLVNSIEANPSDGRISILSPLGQNLIGKTVQDTIEWTTNKFHTQSLQLVRVM